MEAPYEFEDGVTSENAKRYVLVHGGSEELAEKFLAFCKRQESSDPYPAEFQEVVDNVEFLFAICDISDEDIVKELAKRLP